MRELHTEIDIAASADRVWSVLTDFAAFPRWNPFIRRADGDLRAGARLSVRIELPGGRGMILRPTLIAVEPGRHVRWLGHLLVPGLFDGEHRFSIEPLGPARVRFVHSEVFRGLLVPLFAKSLEGGTRRGFEAMNLALKARAESG